MSPPLIGVSACIRTIAERPFHSVSNQYIRAVVEGAGGIPAMLPAIGQAMDAAATVARLDGLLLTGSPSNVEPRHYGGASPRPDNLADPDRDATTLPLIRAAIEAGTPLLAICRGHQELNVALGGTLHQHIHELEGRRDHRSRKDLPQPERYGPAHRVTLAEGGILAGLAGALHATVNSLHAQAIDRLAEPLEIEAVSDDGVVEAVRVKPDLMPHADEFALGIQWHPEYHIGTDALSQAIFRLFGDRARRRAASR